jgi:DNA-binding CsgD family transcriptional regulator
MRSWRKNIMTHESLTARLLAANDFIEVAAAARTVLKHQYGMHQCVITLQALDGVPLLCVDDIAAMTDDLRMLYMIELWRHDPLHQAMRTHHAPVGEELMNVDDIDQHARELGYRGDKAHMLLLPILQTGQLLGTIRCGHLQAFTPEQRRNLTTLSGHVSVRMAQLGITTVPDPLLARLTPRQQDVAQLAARGCTNGDIGRALELSENTIKKHLKDIFDLLEIANRTELAARLSTGPQHHVPIGVTRRGDLWITRGPAFGLTTTATWPSGSTQFPTHD